jgi:hypothetical protein
MPCLYRNVGMPCLYRNVGMPCLYGGKSRHRRPAAIIHFALSYRLMMNLPGRFTFER